MGALAGLRIRSAWRLNARKIAPLIPNRKTGSRGCWPRDLELDLTLCQPVEIDAAMCGKLWALGVRRMVDLSFDAVVFLPGRRFEFARDLRDAAEAEGAVIFPAFDDLGELVDIAAWVPETGRVALLLGRVSMLGEDNVYAPRLGKPLALHETALECSSPTARASLFWTRGGPRPCCTGSGRWPRSASSSAAGCAQP